MANEHATFVCKELVPTVIPDEVEYYQTIIDHVLSHTKYQCSVLVNCKNIHEAEYLAEQLRSKYDAKKVFTYTGESSTCEKKDIVAGDIVCTAAHDTDLKISEFVEFHGGMHVVHTYLPDISRVEIQTFGRKARLR